MEKLRNCFHLYTIDSLVEIYDDFAFGVPIVTMIFLIEVVLLLAIIKMKESEATIMIIQVIKLAKHIFEVPINGVLVFVLRNSIEHSNYALSVFSALVLLMRVFIGFAYHYMNFNSFFNNISNSSRRFTPMPAYYCLLKAFLIAYCVLRKDLEKFEVVLMTGALMMFFLMNIVLSAKRKVTFYN